MYKSNHHPCIHEFEEENNLNQITTAKKKKQIREICSPWPRSSLRGTAAAARRS
jgi:hypothetical protein